jgi:hypothetical protein
LDGVFVERPLDPLLAVFFVLGLSLKRFNLVSIDLQLLDQLVVLRINSVQARQLTQQRRGSLLTRLVEANRRLHLESVEWVRWRPRHLESGRLLLRYLAWPLLTYERLVDAVDEAVFVRQYLQFFLGGSIL